MMHQKFFVFLIPTLLFICVSFSNFATADDRDQVFPLPHKNESAHRSPLSEVQPLEGIIAEINEEEEVVNDEETRQRQELEAHRKRADDAINQIEQIFNNTLKEIEDAAKEIEKARQANIEAINIAEAVKNMNNAYEEDKNASKKASNEAFFALNSAEGSYELAQGRFNDTQKSLSKAKGSRAAITEDPEKRYRNEGYVSQTELEVIEVQRVAKKINDKLQEVNNQVQKILQALERAKTAKAQAESRPNKTQTPTSQNSEGEKNPSNDNTPTNGAEEAETKEDLENKGGTKNVSSGNPNMDGSIITPVWLHLPLLALATLSYLVIF